jgi:signal transduction histidine kinase
MVSNVPTVARRLLTALAAVVGAQAAWSAGYYASFALCCLLLLWAGGWLLAGRGPVGEGESVSERRWADALLQREREARSLAAYLDHAPVPLLALRSGGILSALNLSARRFFATDDVVSDAPPALLNAVMGAAPGERRMLTLETDGLQRAYALTVSELVRDGYVVRMAALVDIQAEIQAAEAAALRELMQVLSHEIMNSLTPVTSLAHTAAELLRADDAALALPQAQEAIEGVARRSEGLLTFVGAYRELARLPEPKLADVSVSRLLDEAALLFRSRWGPSGVSLTVIKPPGEVTTLMDANLMTQVLLNGIDQRR